MNRTLLALLAGVVVFVAVYAAAAGLTLHVLDLGAGDASVLACDNSFRFSFTLDTNNAITHVAVSDIAPECAGGVLSLTLTNSSNAAVGSGSGTVPPGGGSLVVALSPQPHPADVYQEVVAIVGP